MYSNYYYADDISPEEEAIYLGHAPPVSYAPAKEDFIDQYAVAKPTKRKSNFMLQESSTAAVDDIVDDNFQEELDLDEQQFSGPTKQMTLDDADVDEDPLMKGNMEFLVPIRRLGGGRTIVPEHIQSAAGTLLYGCSNDGGNLISLDAHTRNALQQYHGHVDEYTQIDPSVVISASLEITETFRAYLEETISFSEYILIHVLPARFRVQITNTVKTQPIPFDDPNLNLKVRPFSGEDQDRGQPFGIDHSLEAVAKSIDSDRWVQIRAYMLSLGKLSPKTVCDPQFIEDQKEVFKKIISGEYRIVRKRQKKNGTGAVVDK